MSKKYKLLISLIIIFIILILFKSNIVNAATTELSASKTNVTSGTSVTVTANVYAGAWNLSLNGAGQTKGLVGQTNTTDNISANTSITFNANNIGTYTIILTGDVTDYYTDVTSNVNKSITINVTAPTTPNTPTTPTTPTVTKKSNDSKLKALALAEGAISPEFSSSVKEYTLSIPNEITEVNVAATANNSRATYIVSGNKELKEGENTVNVTVKAEDGSTSVYTIKVTRAKAELALTSLGIKYKDNDKKEIVLKLAPEYIANIYKYTLEDLEYYVKKLDIEAIANREEAIVAITGNEELKEGKNVITITLKIPAQEGQEEELKTYTITVNKKAEPIPPTMIEKTLTWISLNKMMVIVISLATCVTLLIILSIYIIVDNFKYRKIIKDLKKKTGDNEEVAEVKEEIVVEETNENKEEKDNVTEEVETEPEEK